MQFAYVLAKEHLQFISKSKLNDPKPNLFHVKRFIKRILNMQALNLFFRPAKTTPFSLPARQSHKHQDQFVSRETL